MCLGPRKGIIDGPNASLKASDKERRGIHGAASPKLKVWQT